VYGDPIPAATFQVYGDVQGTLSGVSCVYTPAVPRNVGSYPITCSSAPTPPTDGVTFVAYNATYNDGTAHTAGGLAITPRPITVTAQQNIKPYDATLSAAASPVITSGNLAYSDTATWTEVYIDPNAGTVKTLVVSTYTILDGNGGGNYSVSTVANSTGVITPAVQTITFGPLSDVTFGSPPFVVNATVSSSAPTPNSGLAVTFTVTSTAGICSVSGSTITLLGSGICNVTASQPGNGNYSAASPVMQSFNSLGFVSTGSMNTARSFHTATLLSSGKVLVVGGLDAKGAPLASAEVYDPVGRSFSSTGNNMPNKAAGHTATLLPNGKVLVVGGGNSASEIYDPATGLWSASGGTFGQRSYHTATLLPNGKVLIAGGSDNSGKTTNTALLYDPSTGNFTNTGNMTVSRDFHTATLLLNGKVLIAGGRTRSGSGYTYQATAEVYDPATGVFTPAGNSMSSARYAHTAVLFNGKVLIAGGASTSAIAGADLYDPSAETFAPTSSLASARQYFTATVFGKGTSVIEVGGLNGSTWLASAEQYQSTGFQSVGIMATPRAAHTATLLNDGSVLITGGQGSGGTSLNTAELLK
jgi:hypothetical protein